MHFRAKLLEGGTVHQRDPAAGSSGRNVYFGCLLTRLTGKFHFGFKFKRKFLELKIGFFFTTLAFFELKNEKSLMNAGWCGTP